MINKSRIEFPKYCGEWSPLSHRETGFHCGPASIKFPHWVKRKFSEHIMSNIINNFYESFHNVSEILNFTLTQS